MKTSLYHERVYLPPDLEYPGGSTAITLTYTKHARQEAREDEHGDITRFLPKEIVPEEWKLVEVEAHGYEILSLLYTKAIPERKLKLAVSLVPTSPKEALVKTVWTNGAKFDFPKLNTARYVQG